MPDRRREDQPRIDLGDVAWNPRHLEDGHALPRSNRGAARKPVRGNSSIARSFAGLHAKLPSLIQRFELREINGWPALVAHNPDGVLLVITFETDGTRIHAIRNILAPDKLRLPHID